MLGNAVAGLKRRGFEGQEPLTLQPAHGQQPAGREVRHRLRYGDVRTIRKEGAVKRHLLGLTTIVQLLAQPVSDLVGHLAGVNRAFDPAKEAKQGAKLTQIALYGAQHVRILQLDGQVTAIEPDRPVNLPERGGSSGLRFKLSKKRSPVWAKLCGHPSPHKGPTHGRGIGLQLGQLGGKFGGQEIGHGRKHLRGLHQGPLQIA